MECIVMAVIVRKLLSLTGKFLKKLNKLSVDPTLMCAKISSEL